MSPKETAYIVERLAVRFMAMVADYERKMVEHRDAFGVRTSADAKIIDGMRAEVEDLRSRLNALGIQAAKQAGEALGMVEGEGLLGAARRVVKERDGLLTQVQDMRAEIERLQWDNTTMQNDAEDGYAEAIKVLGDPIALSKERDALRAEVADLRGIVDMVHASLGIKQGDHIGNAIAALKAHTLKRSHPVAVGGYLRRLTGFGTTPAGEVAQVLHVDCDGPATEYTIKRPNGQPGVWSESGCEPCDPPEASHDTPAGKEAAASVIRRLGGLSRSKRRWPHTSTRCSAPWATADETPRYSKTSSAKSPTLSTPRNSQMTEIKVGDVVEVVSASGGQTWMADVGSTGKVRRFELIDSIECVRLQNLPGKRNALGGYVSLCDVRKVPK